jgi:putative oxidoreductase
MRRTGQAPYRCRPVNSALGLAKNSMPQFRIPATLREPAVRSQAGWLLVRATVACIIAAHGWARLLAGGVAPFGGFLQAQGFPGGFYWAAAVTGIEIVGSVSLLFGRCAAPLALLFSFIYTTGIALVHAKAGWFVVGLGRNGAEFSVLLIACLLAVALQHLRPRGAA